MQNVGESTPNYYHAAAYTVKAAAASLLLYLAEKTSDYALSKLGFSWDGIAAIKLTIGVLWYLSIAATAISASLTGAMFVSAQKEVERKRQ